MFHFWNRYSDNDSVPVVERDETEWKYFGGIRIIRNEGGKIEDSSIYLWKKEVRLTDDELTKHT